MSQFHLSKFMLKNFKSYHEEVVLPLSDFTILIGANASGKTNLLEALRFLCWLAQYNKLSALQYGSTVSPFRGLMKDLCYSGETSFELGCCIAEGSEESLDFSMTMSLRGDELHITQEALYQRGEKVALYQIASPSEGMSTDVSVQYKKFAQGRPPHLTKKCSDQVPIFTQLDNPSLFITEHKKDHEKDHEKAIRKIQVASQRIQKILASLFFLEAIPHEMRGYAFQHDNKVLHSSGKNVSSVLYRLWDESNTLKETILSFIQSLPEQDITGVSFIKTPRGEVMLQLKETFGDRECLHDAAVLSDGTLKVLAIAATLLSVPEGSLVIIEEVDNGVHPSRAKQLITAIKDTARVRKLKILLSTHNPALMDALPDETLGDVVFCHRDKVSGNSKLIRLSDSDDFLPLTMRGPLGHLVTTGTLDKLLKNPVSEEQRLEQAMAFMKSLEEDEV